MEDCQKRMLVGVEPSRRAERPLSRRRIGFIQFPLKSAMRLHVLIGEFIDVHLIPRLSNRLRSCMALSVPPDFNLDRSPAAFFASGHGPRSGPSRFTQSGLV